jgi:endonuclease-3
MDDDKRMVAILDRLRSEFKPWRRYTDNPFLMLVGTVLSQNTNWRNTKTAYERLTSEFKTPRQIARADEREIQKLIRPAGLHRIKSKRLKELSQAICERYGGNIGKVLKKPLAAARQELLLLPGIGYKTADVVLAFSAGRDVLPVDTHVFKISKRLGFAAPKDNHENVRIKLEALVPVGRRGEAHMLLIQHGRRYCRAIKPLCAECSVSKYCPKLVFDYFFI